jgi:DNA modification methylase
MSGAVRDWGVFRIHVGDCVERMREMPAASVQCCVTSPPYFGLRDYGVEGQIGLEDTPDAYVDRLVEVFREVRRVLRDDGTLWLNLGDSYANDSKWGGSTSGKHAQAVHGNSGIGRRRHNTGLKSKDLIGIPWRVAFALQADGWYLRQDIIWHKPNPMPESVRDRCTKAHEYLFLLSKSERYYFDSEAMQEPAVGQNDHDLTGPGYAAPGQAPNRGNRLAKAAVARSGGALTGGVERSTLGTPAAGTRNKRSVWTVSPKPFKGAHFATFPPALIEPCVLAGSPPGGVVLDPFGGAGTTGLVAAQHGRVGVLCELNPAYVDLAERRIATAVFGPCAFGGAAA